MYSKLHERWHKKVYRKKVKEMISPDIWQKLRQKCFKRDDFTCQRCNQRKSYGRGLTAHHIMPRSEGGADDIHNLISLCTSCHDYVEMNDLRTISAIQGSYEEDNIPGMEKPTNSKNEEGYHFERPDWHTWVYGGARNPSKGKDH